MSSRLLNKLEAEYQAGGLEPLAQRALPFFMEHLEDLADFVQAFYRSFGPQPLDLLCKLFILNRNMPFDMAEYMRSQSHFIEENLRHCPEPELMESGTSTRRDAVRQWIQQYAQKHRQEAILRQVFCFDRYGSLVLPAVRQALQGRGIPLED